MPVSLSAPATSGAVLRLLTLNTGSSSLKAALYRIDAAERREFAITMERIGDSGGRIRITDAEGAPALDAARDLPDHAAALDALFAWLRDQRADDALAAVGHRVVHGGMRHRLPERVTPELIADLRALTAIDPDHLPQAIAAIEATRHAYPALPQVACFDTAFHRHLPAVAQRYALPPEYADAGVIRYGFHGLSYESIMDALHAADAEAAGGRVIIAHLGNGASMAAVRGGVGIETTMGYTPAGGLVMSTRTGDLDPGVPLYFMQARGMDAAAIRALVNTQAGMRAVSGTSGDMRDLLARETTDPRAAAAVALFCYTAQKHLGALAAALGGLETLVFTGGIGARAAPVRARICTGLQFLGIHTDRARNDAHAAIISPDGAPVVVRVMPTDEERVIARHTARLIHEGGADGR